MNYPKKAKLTTTFQTLSWQPRKSTVEQNYSVVEQFVTFVYGGSSTSTGQLNFDLNEVRLNKFSLSLNDQLRKLPLSIDALRLKVDRSTYQSGLLIGETLPANLLHSLSGRLGLGNPWRWNYQNKVAKSCKLLQKLDGCRQNMPM